MVGIAMMEPCPTLNGVNHVDVSIYQGNFVSQTAPQNVSLDSSIPPSLPHTYNFEYCQSLELHRLTPAYRTTPTPTPTRTTTPVTKKTKTNNYNYIQTVSGKGNYSHTIQVLPRAVLSTFDSPNQILNSRIAIPAPHRASSISPLPLISELDPLPTDEITSPHEPIYVVTDEDVLFPRRHHRRHPLPLLPNNELQLQHIRNRVESSRPRGNDTFTQFVENRYARFRPSASQHNNEAIMNSMHPYQQDDYGKEKKTALENITNNITSWFKKSLVESPQISKQPLNSDFAAPLAPDLEQNSITRNFLTTGSPSCPPTVPHTQNAENVCTPRGIPINEYFLNYEKLPLEHTNLVEEIDTRREIINSFDDNVRDLVDGSENFLASCIHGVWNFTSLMCTTCLVPLD